MKTILKKQTGTLRKRKNEYLTLSGDPLREKKYIV